MPRGGKRPGAGSGGKRQGAGRKKGAGTKRTRKTNDLAQQAAGEGVLPLQVMLEAMREAYEAKDLKRAVEIAAQAAPYLHRKLAALTVEGGEKPVEIKLVRDRNFYGNSERLPPG